MAANSQGRSEDTSEVVQLFSRLEEVTHEVERSDLPRGEKDNLLMDINLATQFIGRTAPNLTQEEE